MKPGCPRDDELLLLVSGELTQNRATELRAHVDGCSRCCAHVQEWNQLHAGIAADMPSIDPRRASESVMRRLRSAEQAAPSPRGFRAWYLMGGAAVAAAAAVVLLLSVGGRGGVTPGARNTFQPRGGQPRPELARKVGVQFYAMQGKVLARIKKGERLSAEAKLTLSYVSAVASRKVYMLAFALDAAGELHWLYPAYSSPKTNPAAIELRTSDVEIVLPETVQLEAPAAGALRLFWIVSFDRMTVADVETLARRDRTSAFMKKRWPGADVGNVPVSLTR